MVPPEMVPAEETVEALMEGLVSPFLPRCSISWDSPNPEQQEVVAKQMYAVVLLYNYYHRKMFQKLEFLNFNSFCKVACISKPSLLKYMNAMYKSDMSLGDMDEPLSITERMIMDACNVSLALDASKDAPDMEGWPISKVAVFLVDSSKEHCLLRSSGSTHAITKSLVEKNLEIQLENFVCVPEMNNASGSSACKFNDSEDTLRQVAFSTVKEEMGISHSNLSILGCHLSYSLSHMKSCTRLYIMTYAGPVDNQIPIKDVMQSLQGPIVKNNSAPEVTGVVGYYSLLPYIDILSDWLSRKISHSTSQHTIGQKTNVFNKGPEGVIVIDIHEVSDDSGWSHGKTNNNCSVKEEANEDDSPTLTEQNRDTLMNKKRKVKNDLAGSTGAAHQFNGDDSATKNQKTLDRYKETNSNNAILHDSLNATKKGLDEVGGPMSNMIITLNSNNHGSLALSKNFDMISVLQKLKKKRDELCRQQRILEDNIAHCEMSIQTVLSGKDSSESKVELMLKTCELLFSNVMKNDPNLSTEAQCQSQTTTRKKLCEAVLRLQSPCQELDEIFCTNNWILPKYCVLPATDGKFQALVIVRGVDFECDSNGDWKSSPEKARESAATHVLSKLRSMAAQQIDS